MPVYRGTVTRVDTLLVEPEKYFVGNIVQWRGFTGSYMPGGTSAHKGMAHFTIESTNGRIVEHIAAHEHERECLFIPGSKFKVLKVDKLLDSVYFIKLQQVE